MQRTRSRLLLVASLVLLTALAFGAWATGEGCWFDSEIGVDCAQGTICVDWYRYGSGFVFTCCIDQTDLPLDDPSSCIPGTKTDFPVATLLRPGLNS